MQKKKISQKEFDKKMKLWSMLIPLIICVISSLTTGVVAYFSGTSRVEYKIPEKDQVEINRLAAQIKLLGERYYQAQDSLEKEKLDAELNVLAEAEANIMRKYIPNYQKRWPIIIVNYEIRSPFFIFLIIVSLILFGILRTLAVWILRARYETEHNVN